MRSEKVPDVLDVKCILLQMASELLSQSDDLINQEDTSNQL